MKVGPVDPSGQWAHVIQGDVEIAGYEGWVAVDSLDYEIKHSEAEASKRSDAESDQEPDAPVLEAFNVDKATTDSSGPDFMRWIVDGTEMKVQLDVCVAASPGHFKGDRASKEPVRCLARYTLEHVTLASYSVNLESSASKATMTVAMALHYEVLNVEYFSFDRANAQPKRTTGWIRRQQADG